jgi:hypothetical protein
VRKWRLNVNKGKTRAGRNDETEIDGTKDERLMLRTRDTKEGKGFHKNDGCHKTKRGWVFITMKKGHRSVWWSIVKRRDGVAGVVLQWEGVLVPGIFFCGCP